jgi:hypothetical protein
MKKIISLAVVLISIVAFGQTVSTTPGAGGVGGGITNSAGNNVVPKSNGTNIVASSITTTEPRFPQRSL